MPFCALLWSITKVSWVTTSEVAFCWPSVTWPLQEREALPCLLCLLTPGAEGHSQKVL